MNTKHTYEPTRIEELYDFIQVIRTISGINNGSHAIDKIKDCSEKCQKLERSDLIGARQSFTRHVISCVNACAGMDDPAAEIAKLRASNAELLAAVKRFKAATEAYESLDFPGGRKADELQFSKEALFAAIAKAETVK